MRPIQPILIVMLITVVFLYVGRFRSGLLDRLAVLAFGVVGITLAIFPKLAAKFAELVGVGRGADLFIYLAIVGLFFFFLVLYSKFREIESSMAEMVRAFSIEQALLRKRGKPRGAQADQLPHGEK